MVSRLHLKLLRDMRAAKWQFLAISLVSGLGVAMFYGSIIAYNNQKKSYELSYSIMQFADLTIDLKRAPRSVAENAAHMPGVRAVEARIVKDVEMDQRHGRRPRVIGRLISFPMGSEPTVDRVRILEGRPLASGREALLETSFARANHYHPGDRIYPRLNGWQVAFTVVGIVSSPEYIYPLPSNQSDVPLPETFGVLFVPQDSLESLLGMAGSINELIFLTDAGQARAIGALVAHRLHAYGPKDPQLQADQPSNKLLQSDLNGWTPFLLVMPSLFLASAALAVSLVLARWAQAQRSQIGFLRASGFPAPAVLIHYLEAGLIVGACGGAIGLLIGHVIGWAMGEAYAKVLQSPYPVRQEYPGDAAVSVLLSLVACLLGSLGPARQAAAVPPAQAMRGDPASTANPPRIRLPLNLAIPFRNLCRRPLRTAGTAAGIACSSALLVIAGSFQDSMDRMMDIFLRETQRYDVSVIFVPERSQSILSHIRKWPGVLRVEPSLDISVRVDYNGVTKETVATGLEPGAQLQRLPGADGQPLIPLPGTLLVSELMARRLHVEPGDLIGLRYFQNTLEQHAHTWMHAGPLVHQPVGLPVYLRMDDMRERFAEPLGLPPDAISGAFLKADPQYTESIRARLQQIDGVALVQTKAELEAQLDALTAYSRLFIGFMFLLGAGMAFAVTYTATDNVLWERTRELATLRTLGFGMKSISRLVSIENLMMGFLGTLSGVYPGYWLARYLGDANQTEGFSMDTVVFPRTYAIAILGVLLVVLIAQRPGLRRILTLDLAEAVRMRGE